MSGVSGAKCGGCQAAENGGDANARSVAVKERSDGVRAFAGDGVTSPGGQPAAESDAAFRVDDEQVSGRLQAEPGGLRAVGIVDESEARPLQIGMTPLKFHDGPRRLRPSAGTENQQVDMSEFLAIFQNCLQFIQPGPRARATRGERA